MTYDWRNIQCNIKEKFVLTSLIVYLGVVVVWDCIKRVLLTASEENPELPK